MTPSANNWSTKTNQTTIRRMQPSDAAAVVNVLEQSPEATPWSRGSLDQAAQGQAAWVATSENEGICGFLIGQVAADEFEILNLAVTPDFRRRGIGSKLLQEALDYSRSAGCARAFLEVRESNSAGISLYHRSGFRECGQRPHYYTSPPGDALLLFLNLATRP